MDAWQDTKNHIATYYDRLISCYGHDPRACDYGRASSQACKFGVLAQVTDLAGSSVLDVGCGLADFADYLGGKYPGVRYEGVDISPRMIEEARRLRPALHLECLDILGSTLSGPYDLVTANGIFYLLGENAREMMHRLITRMFELSRDAVAFNSLSSWAPQQEPGEFYADPVETLSFCRTLTQHVVLRHDYMRHDFTIYLYREPKTQ